MSKVKINIQENVIQHEMMNDLPVRSNYLSTEIHTKLSSDVLSDSFCIIPKRAKVTLLETTKTLMR